MIAWVLRLCALGGAVALLDGSVPASRGVGGGLASTVIRRSPALVGRVAGELLYRDLAP